MEVLAIDFTSVFLFLTFSTVVVFSLAGLAYVAFTFFKFRKREERSIDSVLLQVGVPRGNEIKIDAMEQLFASLYSIKKGGWKKKFSVQPAVSFEIVANKEEIRFYVGKPRELKDLMEK